MNKTVFWLPIVMLLQGAFSPLPAAEIQPLSSNALPKVLIIGDYISLGFTPHCSNC